MIGPSKAFIADTYNHLSRLDSLSLILKAGVLRIGQPVEKHDEAVGKLVGRAFGAAFGKCNSPSSITSSIAPS